MKERDLGLLVQLSEESMNDVMGYYNSIQLVNPDGSINEDNVRKMKKRMAKTATSFRKALEEINARRKAESATYCSLCGKDHCERVGLSFYEDE